ncbi:MAG: tetratricopeptide repeat protein [Pseudomonadota bacterium]
MYAWVCAILFGILTGCAAQPANTLASLETKPMVVAPGQLRTQSNAQVIAAYREFLATTSPTDPRYKEATQRLADLEMKTGEQAVDKVWEQQFVKAYQEATRGEKHESDEHYRAALKSYDELLKARPGDRRNDWVLYQSARAYEELGEPRKAAHMLGRLAREFPQSRFANEAQMRQAELLFLALDYAEAEKAYLAVLSVGKRSQYYVNALYKMGWSQFKQERFFAAIDTFLVLYDELHMPDDPFVSKAQYDAGAGEMRRDLINVITLSFAYSKGADGLAEYFRNHASRGDKAVIYQYVLNHFQKQARYKEAVDVCQSYIQLYPNNADALRFQQQILEIYEASRQPALLWASRAQFAERFSPASEYWRLQDATTQNELRELVRNAVLQLSAYHHAQAQSTHRQEHSVEAIKWYRNYLTWFRDAADVGAINFLFAEILFEQGMYGDAVKEYLRTAYDAGDHPKAAEAGYALTVTLDKLGQAAKDAQKAVWKRQAALAGLRFAKRFANDARVATVLAHSADIFLELGDTAQAKSVAEGLLQKGSKELTPQIRRAALIVVAQVATQENNLDAAERNYRASLALGDSANKRGDLEVRERLATITFKHAEQQLASGDLTNAAAGFARVMQEGGGTSVAPVAHYNAATILMKQERWADASAMLEDFRTRFATHELRNGVSEKLALAYVKTGQFAKAALEYEQVARAAKDIETRRMAAWQAAELWGREKKKDKVIAALDFYRQNFAEPKDAHLEATIKLASLYRAMRHSGFDEITKAALAGAVSRRATLSAEARVDVSRLAIAMADERFDAFRAVKLNLPLKKSLARKKQAMDVALAAYAKVGELEIGEAITASTHRVAEIYQWFGREINESERPKKLSKDEREQYDLQLEEEAVPFEEKAIVLYEANVKRAKDGLYDVWVQRSFDALKKLKPARYSKVERSEPVFATID